MPLRRLLIASATLALAGPAFAQDAPTTPPAPPAPAEAPAEAPPAAVTARVEAAGEALKTVMADLEPRAAAIRADANLSAEDKSARIQALLTPHQPVLDEFTAAIRDLVSFQAAAEGASPDEIAGAMSMIGPMISAQIIQALVTGEMGDDGA